MELIWLSCLNRAKDNEILLNLRDVISYLQLNATHNRGIPSLSPLPFTLLIYTHWPLGLLACICTHLAHTSTAEIPYKLIIN